MDFLRDLVGDLRRAFPHGIIGDGDLILLVGRCPCSVLFNDLQGIVAPDRAMGGSYHLDGQVQLADLIQFLCQDRSEGVQYVGKILHGLLVQQAGIGLIVEQLLDGAVLPEGVVGEQDVIAGHVRRHGIRPVQHLHLYKHQLLAVADVHAVASLDHMEVPAPLAILAFDALDCLGSAVDGRARNLVHQRGQGAGVVAFAMISHDEVDLLEVALPFQVLHEIKAMGRPNRVDQDGLSFLDQVGVLAGAVHDGIIVPMEALQLPVDIADPADISLDVLSHAAILLKTLFLSFLFTPLDIAAAIAKLIVADAIVVKI